jgi:hypothetical protein
MNAEEIMKKYDQQYDKMATSDNIENMKLFGRIGREAMVLLARNVPEKAQELTEKLCAMNWNNYLTEREAEAITEKMVPQRPWPRDQWRAVMEQHGYKMSEEPYYNCWALYVTMCMIYTDDIETLKHYVSGVDMFEVLYALALNKLKDRDKVFNVREYFKV